MVALVHSIYSQSVMTTEIPNFNINGRYGDYIDITQVGNKAELLHLEHIVNSCVVVMLLNIYSPLVDCWEFCKLNEFEIVSCSNI